MSAPVLAVFSGTDVDQHLFDRALEIARTENRPLLLLDVRHKQRAARLEDYLDSESLLGRATVKALTKSIKQQRDRAIGQALEAMAEAAREAGVEVSMQVEKGEFETAVLRAARSAAAATVLVPAGPHWQDVTREFETLQV